MREYIERAAALDICQKEYEDRLKMADYCGDTVAWNIGGAIKSIPAADVVEVVRCHECTKSTKGGASYVWCHGWGRNTEMPLDGFCSKGQRKEADHEVS